MSLLFNSVYLLLLMGATPWIVYSAITKGKYREGWLQKLFGLVPRRNSDAPCVWLHGVSVGEINVLATIIDELQTRFPEFDYVVSSTTKTGFDLATTKFEGQTVFYFPFDFSWAIRNVLRRLRPDVLILGELELWPNLIRIADSSSIDVAVVNARLSENSFQGYKRIKPIISRALRRIELLAVQTDEYAQRFRALGAGHESISVTGSTKFDGAEANRQNSRTRALARLAGITEADRVFLAGSTQDPEEALALQTFRTLMDDHRDLKLILVPRHPERFNSVAQLLRESGLPWSRRSELAEDSNPVRILLVDTIGELGAWWGTAEICYVGGSMGDRGGQNMIEPAAYGSAVSFGPKTKNFRDVVRMMLDSDSAAVVNNGEELTQFVRRHLTDDVYHDAMCHRAASLVRKNSGALARTVDRLAPLLRRRVHLKHMSAEIPQTHVASKNA